VTIIVESRRTSSVKTLTNESAAYLELHTCIRLTVTVRIFFPNQQSIVTAPSCR